METTTATSITTDNTIHTATNNTYTTTATPNITSNNIYTTPSWINIPNATVATTSYTISTAQTGFITIKDINEFKKIEELVPQKVYRFTFHDGTVVKTICAETDVFDLEYAFYLALSKKLFSKTHTFSGILYKTQELYFQKYYAKIVKKGIKLFNKTQKEKQEKEEQKEIKKRQHEKYVAKKIRAKERKKLEQMQLIAEAIKLSKEEE